MCTKKHRLSGNERTKGVFFFEESLLFLYKTLKLCLFSLNNETLELEGK